MPPKPVAAATKSPPKAAAPPKAAPPKVAAPKAAPTKAAPPSRSPPKAAPTKTSPTKTAEPKKDAGMAAIQNLLNQANSDKPAEPPNAGSGGMSAIQALLQQANSIPGGDSQQAPKVEAEKKGGLNAIQALLAKAQGGNDAEETLEVGPDGQFVKPDGPVPSELDAVEVLVKNHQFDASTDEKIEQFIRQHEIDVKRICDLEKLKSDYEQMVDLKKTWLHTQEQLQQDLFDARKDAKDTKARCDAELISASQTAELALMDKEIAEEKVKQYESKMTAQSLQLEETLLELEILKLQHGENRDKFEEFAESSLYTQMERQANRLKNALKTLQDKYESEVSEKEDFKNAYINEKTTQSSLQHTVDTLTKTVKSKEKEILALKEQLDAATGVQTVVDRYSQRNVVLEEEVKILKAEVKELHELININDEFDEVRETTESALSKLVDSQAEQIHKLEDALEVSQERGQELTKTLESLKNKFARTTSSGRPESPVSSTLSSSMLVVEEAESEAIQAQMLANVERGLARELVHGVHALSLTLAQEEVKLLKGCLPESFFVSDYNGIQMRLVLLRIARKASLIGHYTRGVYKLDQDITSLLGEGSVITIDAASFGFSLSAVLSEISSDASFLEYVLGRCEDTPYAVLCRQFDLMVSHEALLTSTIEKIESLQFDPTLPLPPFQRAASDLANLAGSYRAAYPLPSVSLLKDSLWRLVGSAEVVDLEIRRLEKIFAAEHADAGLREIMDMLRNDQSSNRETKISAKRLLKDTGDDTELNIEFTPEKRKAMLDALVDYSHVALGLRETTEAIKNHMYSSSVNVQSVGYAKAINLGISKRLDMTSKADGVAKARQEGADESTMPFPMHEIISAVYSFTQEFKDDFEQGLYDIPQAPKTNTEDPWLKRVGTVREHLTSALSLGEQLDSKKKEIVELRTSLKKKDKEISEQAVVLQSATLRAEQARAELEHKTELFRTRVEASRVEERKREEFKFEFSSEIERKIALVIEGAKADLRAAQLQIEILRNALRYTKSEVARLRGVAGLEHLKSIPEVPVIAPSQLRSYQTPKIAMETAALLRKVQLISADPHVVDVTHRYLPGEKTKEGPMSVLNNRASQVTSIASRNSRLRSQFNSYVMDLHEEARISTKFAQFLVPTFVKMTAERRSPHCAGKIIVPSSGRGPKGPREVFLDHAEMAVLHSSFFN